MPHIAKKFQYQTDFSSIMDYFLLPRMSYFVVVGVPYQIKDTDLTTFCKHPLRLGQVPVEGEDLNSGICLKHCSTSKNDLTYEE